MFSLRSSSHGELMLLRLAFLLSAIVLSSAELTAQYAVLPSPDHDFGAVKQGQKLTHTFTIRNSTASPMRIERIELSEHGITTRFKPEIAPGSDGQVMLEWDTSRANGEAEAIAVVRFWG
jgi:hypothetical protein